MSEAHEGEVVDRYDQPIGVGLPSYNQWDLLDQATQEHRGARGRVVASRRSERWAHAVECEERGWLELTGPPGQGGAMWRATEAGREVARRSRVELDRQDAEAEAARERGQEVRRG